MLTANASNYLYIIHEWRWFNRKKIVKGVALAVIAYCIELIAVEAPAALSIAEITGIVSRDAINRALLAIDDDLGKIIMFITQLLKSQTAISGCLIIDDIIIRKPYGPKLPYISKSGFAMKQWIHSHRQL